MNIKILSAVAALSTLIAACGGGGGSGGQAGIPGIAPNTSVSPAATDPAASSPSYTPAPKYALGGSVTGANEDGVTLRTNGGDSITLAKDGSFTFAQQLTTGSTYTVTAMPMNLSKSCTVGNASGTIGKADVTDLNVVCAATTYPVGGSVVGMVGSGLILQNNAGDDLVVDSNGRFSFSTPVAMGGNYAVSISKNPEGEACKVENGKGSAWASVSNVAVTCFPVTAQVTTLAGSPYRGWNDGVGVEASFDQPFDVAVDANGNLYVADYGNKLIRKITPTKEVTTLTVRHLGFADGDPSAVARFDLPTAIALDNVGNIYVTDEGRVLKVTPQGVVTTLAGSGNGYSLDGIGEAASFGSLQGIAVDSQGTVYVTDSGNNSIRRITSTGVVSTLAGSGPWGAVDGTGTSASFNAPWGIAVAASGNVYVADTGNGAIRRITPQGVVTTVVAGPNKGGTSMLSSPIGIDVDASENLYVTDSGLVRKITPTGLVSTVAGLPRLGQGIVDGTNIDATFGDPRGLALGPDGAIYVADTDNVIRKVTIVPAH